MPAIIFDKVVTPFLTSVTTLYRSDLFVGVGPTCLVVPCCVYRVSEACYSFYDACKVNEKYWQFFSPLNKLCSIIKMLPILDNMCCSTNSD